MNPFIKMFSQWGGALWRPLKKYDKQLKIDSTNFKWLIFEKFLQAGKIATKLVKTFSISVVVVVVVPRSKVKNNLVKWIKIYLRWD